MIKGILITLLLASRADSARYEGTWSTEGDRKLDGAMTCLVTGPDGNGKWLATFAGKWQESPFSHTVRFTGEKDNLRGKATVDGVEYQWSGAITDESFVGKFTNGRYKGRFKLKSEKKSEARHWCDVEDEAPQPEYTITLDEEATQHEGIPMWKLTGSRDGEKHEEIPEYKARRLFFERKQQEYASTFSDDFEGNGDDRRRVRREYHELFADDFEKDRAFGWPPFIDKRGIYYSDAGIVW